MAGLRDVAGRVAVVTGASSGIGAALAVALARRGARVALVARRRDRLEALAKEIERDGGVARVVVADVSSRDSVHDAASDVLAHWDRIDLLVNAAGFARHILFKDHDVSDMERMLQTNLLGCVYWIERVLAPMRARGEGWIVNVSSFAGKLGQPDEAAYSASKFALTGLSEALAHEFAPLGIHVLCVHPVLVRTEMFSPEILARMPRASLRSFIEPADFAERSLRALARGETDVVIPRRFGWVPVLHSLFPRWVGRGVARVKLASLPDLTR